MGYGLPDSENLSGTAPQTPDPVANMFGGGGMFDEPAPSQHTEITAKIGQPPSVTPNPSSAFAMSNFGTVPKSFDDWIADPQNVQKIPTRPLVQGQTGKSFAGMALATALDSIGAALSGNKPTVGANWNSQIQAGREYDRTAPAMQQQANEAAYYNKYLPGQNLTSEINQRNMINPFYQNAQKEIGELSQAWQSGIAPDAFDKMVQLKQSTSPYARFITPQILAQIKSLPQQPPKFTAGPNGIEPLIYRGQNYGVNPTQGEPPEITQARQMALDAQKQNQQNELNKKAAEFPPAVTAELGAAPIGDPVKMADYGKKAEAIITRMAAAPKIQIMNAGVGDPNSDEHKALIAAVANGAMPIEQAFPRMATEQQRASVVKEVMAANPSWNAANFGASKKVLEYFTSGEGAKNINAFNTATEHLGQLSKLADALGNGDNQTVNSVTNAVKAWAGDAAPTNFNSVKTAVAGELGKTFKGNVTDEEMKAINKNINDAQSPAQLHGAIEQSLSLMKSKMGANLDQFQSGRGVNPTPAFNAGGSDTVVEYVRDASGKLVPKGKK